MAIPISPNSSALLGPGSATHVVYHACELQRALVSPLGHAARDAADQFSTGPSSWSLFPAASWLASGSGLVEHYNRTFLYEAHELTRA
ncbi:MAG TPA: hypothetical protein VG963_34585, partial [Polyangiaceae bacterium]|nr:hypothetical protein [Polyangiaceae bacterium]